MNLWNLTTMFVLPRADQPSSAYDPSRTGDPVGIPPARPAIGLGDTRVGGSAAETVEPRRRPIGFAPPEGPKTPASFRTEISFKRHHELPRASASPSQDDWPDQQEQLRWPTPALVPDPAPAEVAAEEPADDGATPFYRREISFRRKKAAPVEPVAEAVADDDVVVADVVAVEPVEEPVVAEAVEVVEAVEAVAADEVVAGELPDEKVVPFYKREIGFGR
jgi:hypothetical protein